MDCCFNLLAQSDTCSKNIKEDFNPLCDFREAVDSVFYNYLSFPKKTPPYAILTKNVFDELKFFDFLKED